MTQVASDILSQAIARNSAAVLSLLSDGVFQHHKSRFLDETAEGIWLESIAAEQPLIQSLIAEGQPCGVSFKQADQKAIFTAKALRLATEYRINEKTVLPAVLLARPNAVKVAQWRQNYRVRVPADFELSVRVWQIPEHFYLTDKPPRTAELALKVRDLSAGGIGVTLLPQEGKPPAILAGQRLRVAIKYGAGEELIVEGRIRTIRDGDDQSICTGVQFLKLQDGLEGRQALSELTKIVGALQLEEVRCRRMGIAF